MTQKSQKSIQELIKNGARVIDVRSESEYKECHFKNAENIPVSLITSGLVDLGKDKDAPIILYCASGHRSGVSAEFFRSKGYTNVVNAGGLKDMLLIVQ